MAISCLLSIATILLRHFLYAILAITTAPTTTTSIAVIFVIIVPPRALFRLHLSHVPPVLPPVWRFKGLPDPRCMDRALLVISAVAICTTTAIVIVIVFAFIVFIVIVFISPRSRVDFESSPPFVREVRPHFRLCASERWSSWRSQSQRYH